MDPPRPRPPCILRLTGVSLADHTPIEDIADERLLAEGGEDPDAAPPESAFPLNKIPQVFTSLEDWPLHTNLRCWQCDLTFDDRPKFVCTYAREAEESPTGIECGVSGNTCSFNCAAELIRAQLETQAEKLWRAQDNLNFVYFLFTGRRIAYIPPAPPKTERREYGGELDVDAYTKKLRALDAFAGLRDHTPGSILPTRLRARGPPPEVPAGPARALAAQGILRGRAKACGSPLGRAVAAEAEGEPPPGGRTAEGLHLVSPRSVWSACGLARAAPAAAREEKSPPPPPQVAARPAARKAQEPQDHPNGLPAGARRPAEGDSRGSPREDSVAIADIPPRLAPASRPAALAGAPAEADSSGRGAGSGASPDDDLEDALAALLEDEAPAPQPAGGLPALHTAPTPTPLDDLLADLGL